MKLSLRHLKAIVFSDPKGKSIAVIVAIFLWYFVNVFSIEKIYISLPITIENQPQDKEVQIATKELVARVEILAYEDVSRRIQDLSAVIDLSNYKIGTQEYPVLLRNLPHDIKAKITPSHKKVSIYSVVTNTVPLNVRVAPHIELTNVTYTPETVQIVGSSQQLARISSINSVNLDFELPMTNFLKTNIDIIYPKNIKVLYNKTIPVSLYFEQTFYTNEVFLPIEYTNLNPNLIVTGSNAIVLTLLTKTNEIEDLLLQTTVNIDLTNIITPGNYSLPLQIHTPTNMMILNAPTNFKLVLSQPSTNKDSRVYEIFGDTLNASLEGVDTSNKKSSTIKETNLINTNIVDPINYSYDGVNLDD